MNDEACEEHASERESENELRRDHAHGRECPPCECPLEHSREAARNAHQLVVVNGRGHARDEHHQR